VKQLLSIRNVSKYYGRGPSRVTAVDRVSLCVGSGEVILILGPSGSGKTTLLSIMGCLLRPTHGEVFANGTNVYQLPDGELSRLRRERIGFVFQSFNLLGFLTVRQNVEVVLNLGGIRGQQARERATELLRWVKLDHRLEFRPRDLSGGEKQRVSIARALANDPMLILADEPTGSLDSKTGRIVVDLLAALARDRGSGVVIVSHDQRIMDAADRVLYLGDGVLTEYSEG
jgi:putative ABC transport system ATP-binding protein